MGKLKIHLAYALNINWKPGKRWAMGVKGTVH